MFARQGMLIDWQDVLWYAAVASAFSGGIVSVIAYSFRTRHEGNDENARKTHLLYLVSYILMSVSIFFIAFRGLLQ